MRLVRLNNDVQMKGAVMATVADRRKLLYKLAKAYYEDQLTQAQIGKRFGLSRIKVSRLL